MQISTRHSQGRRLTLVLDRNVHAKARLPSMPRGGSDAMTSPAERPFRIAIVVGMKAESRIADAGDLTIIGGGSAAQVEAGLSQAMGRAKAEGRPLQGVLSFGIAGGLAAHLKPGDLVLPTSVHTGSQAYVCHPGWSASLSKNLPHAHRGALAGVDVAVGTPEAKRQLHRVRGALAVDMESHVAARLAEAWGLPFAALRAIADPHHRALPPAALVGMKEDGSADVKAVLAALARRPNQLGQLILTAFDAQAGMRALLRSRGQLGAFFGFDDLV
jgi:hopanoid-associated phosphorylase